MANVRIRSVLCVAVIVASAVIARRGTAQVVERQVAFDTAGRIMEVTPSLAARLVLAPPAWSITGDYVAARLYTAGDSTYVLVVTRRDGTLERVPLARAEFVALRDRLNAVPVALVGDRQAQHDFVHDQLLLGLLVYGPTAAASMGHHDGAGATGAYLLAAGGSFFVASRAAGAVTASAVTLSTHAAVRGALGGGALMYMGRASDRAIAGGALAGGLLGSTLGVIMGRSLTPAEATAAGFGADVAALTTLGVVAMINGERAHHPISNRARAGLITAAGLIGYPIGVLYPRNANYNVTPGDVSTLWVTGALGALAASNFVANGHPSSGLVAASLTGGFVLGTMMGDRFLVQQVDHSTGDATVLAMGTLAGGLVGTGAYVLADRHGRHPALGTSLATAGALIGLMATESFIATDPDAGHRPRMSFQPANLLLLALDRAPGGAPYAVPLLSVRF